MEFTFSGLESAVKRICEKKGIAMGEDERRKLARESMRLAFEHLASRVGWAVRDLEKKAEGVETLVVSGGVASNGFLRHVYVPSFPFNYVHTYRSPMLKFLSQSPRLPHCAGLSLYKSHLPTRCTLHR